MRHDGGKCVTPKMPKIVVLFLACDRAEGIVFFSLVSLAKDPSKLIVFVAFRHKSFQSPRRGEIRRLTTYRQKSVNLTPQVGRDLRPAQSEPERIDSPNGVI